MIIRNLSRKARTKERGMASLLYIMLIALILCMTGASIDGAMGNYTSNSLKDASDASARTASAQTYYVGSKRAVDSKRAKAMFEKLYMAHRKNYPNVTIKGAPKISYSITKTRGSSVKNTFTVTVKEKSKTHFIGIVGIHEFNHNIKSTARLGSLYETKSKLIGKMASNNIDNSVDSNIQGSWG